MKFYLRYVNPAIALITLVLCTWAAVFADEKFQISGIIAGGLSTYFFAKGLFTCAAIFLLGQILLLIVIESEKTEAQVSRRNWIYFVLLIVFTTGLIFGMVKVRAHAFKKEKKTEFVSFSNPDNIKILEGTRVVQANKVRITGKIKNISDETLSSCRVTAHIFIDGIYSDKESVGIETLEPGGEEYFVVDSDIWSDRVKENKVTFKLQVSDAKKEKKK